MSITSMLSTIFRSGVPCLQKQLSLWNFCSKKAFHGIIACNSAILPERQFLDAFLLRRTVLVQPDRGLKYKGVVKKRCKDCYFVVRDERMYVMCKTHPRHKQAALQKKEKYKRILTHATQSPVRPW